MEQPEIIDNKTVIDKTHTDNNFKSIMNKTFNKVIVYALFEKLSLTDLRTCGILNRQFNAVFKLDMLWEFLFERDFGFKMKDYREAITGESAKTIYWEYSA